MISDDFTTSLSGIWTQEAGTWTISSNKANVSALTGSKAILLANADLDTISYSLEVTFPAGSSTKKAGLVFAHDGNDNYYAVVLDRSAGKLALHQITSGSWGSALAGAHATINDSTAYTLKVNRKQRRIEAVVGSVSIEYDSSTDFGTGHSGVYADKTSVTFDDFLAHQATARNPLVPRFVGSADASLSAGELLVQGQTRGGEAIVDGFSDDDYMVKLDVDLNSGTHADLWVRYTDANNGYKLTLDSAGLIELFKVHLGKSTSLASVEYTTAQSVTVRVKVNEDTIKAWVGETQVINTTDSTHTAGGVALGGDQPKFDDLKVGYDTECDQSGSTKPDDDLTASDDLVLDEAFASTDTTFTHDAEGDQVGSLKGNLIDDGHFVYVYDAWHRLVKTRSSNAERDQ